MLILHIVGILLLSILSSYVTIGLLLSLTGSDGGKGAAGVLLFMWPVLSIIFSIILWNEVIKKQAWTKALIILFLSLGGLIILWF